MKITSEAGRTYTFEKGRLLKDGNEIDNQVEIIPKGNNCFQLLRGQRSFDAFLLRADFEEKSFDIRIDGTTYTLSLKDRFDELLEKMGISDMAGAKAVEIKAPMPGLVLKIEANPGQEVQKGDPVIVLEAMKMENILKAPAAGTIKAIHVETGAAVEKNEMLVSFE